MYETHYKLLNFDEELSHLVFENNGLEELVIEEHTLQICCKEQLTQLSVRTKNSLSCYLEFNIKLYVFEMWKPLFLLI